MGLINKSKVKKFSLDIANEKAKRSLPDKWTDSTGKKWDMARCNSLSDRKQFTQVSQDYLNDVESEVRNLIKKKIKLIPLVGKTLK